MCGDDDECRCVAPRKLDLQKDKDNVETIAADHWQKET
jgi:hypothetical protein